jgi:hypothetical protein
LENLDYSGLTETLLDRYNTILQNSNVIYVPTKVEYNLKKYFPKTLLKEIDPDINVAIEKCLLFVSNLISTYFTEDKWKSLHSSILSNQMGGQNENGIQIYIKVLKALTTGTKQAGPFIEVNDSFQSGISSKKYKLGEAYINKGLVKYTINSQEIIFRRNSEYFKLLTKANDGTITNNLLKLYPSLQLPTSKDLLIEGKRLVKTGYTTKKGKILTLRNKNSNNHWVDISNRSFVEDNIKLYEILTSIGLMIPFSGSEKSGGRVVDSFVLMPSWIRQMITINGTKLVESDFKALHPNLAVKLYGGNTKHLTHQKVAETLNIDVKTAKIEHLSFFNKRSVDMIKSPLYSFYKESEPKMLQNIIEEKKDKGYKETSKKLFKLEVDIMSEVIKRLNRKNIFVLYVYDALYSTPKDFDMVNKTMNEVVEEFGVHTSAPSDESIVEPTNNKYQMKLNNGVIVTIPFNYNEVYEWLMDQKNTMKQLKCYSSEKSIILELDIQINKKKEFDDTYKLYV